MHARFFSQLVCTRKTKQGLFLHARGSSCGQILEARWLFVARLARKRVEAHEETTRQTASRVSVRHATKRADITDLEARWPASGARFSRAWRKETGRVWSGRLSWEGTEAAQSLSLCRFIGDDSTVEIAGKRVHRLRWPGMLQRTGCYVLA